MILIPREVLHLVVKVRFADVSEGISASFSRSESVGEKWERSEVPAPGQS